MTIRLVWYKAFTAAILNSLKVITFLCCCTLHTADAGICVRRYGTIPLSTLFFFATTTTASIIIVEKPGNSTRNESSLFPGEEIFESQPALFGKPFQEGRQYKAHLQIVKLDRNKSRRDMDQFLCGGVDDEIDVDSDDLYSKTFFNGKGNPSLSAIKNDKYEGERLDDKFDCGGDESSYMNSVAASWFDFGREVTATDLTEDKGDGNRNENYDITVPKDGIPGEIYFIIFL